MNPFEIIKALPNEVSEFLSFAVFVLTGSLFKMKSQKEKGLKITFARFIVETVMSFFIACVAYAFLNQFFDFNTFFICAVCSLAGSLSSSLFHSKLEELTTTLFDGAKSRINQVLKTTKNEQ